MDGLIGPLDSDSETSECTGPLFAHLTMLAECFCNGILLPQCVVYTNFKVLA